VAAHSDEGSSANGRDRQDQPLQAETWIAAAGGEAG
jgi:hypothetical protein